MQRATLPIVLALLLCACAGQKLEPRQGAPIGAAFPQAAEQCRAQPELDWCAAAARRAADARR